MAKLTPYVKLNEQELVYTYGHMLHTLFIEREKIIILPGETINCYYLIE